MQQNWPIDYTTQLLAAIEYNRQLHQQFYQQPPLPVEGPPPRPRTPITLSSNSSDEAGEMDDNDEEKRTLFCANLDERLTEQLLYELFLQAGPIEQVRIPKENNGKQRSFGFVTFVHRCSAPYAMELMQGLTLYRKNITIKYQGSAQLPTKRRLPTDCEPYRAKRERYDNSSLRNSNYPAYYDISMNDSKSINAGSRSSGTSSALKNPFKKDLPDWLLGSSSSGGRQEKDRISKHSSSSSARSHQRSTPYARPETRQSEREQHLQRNRHHNGGDRRSEQRSGGHRR